jgi:hypothetical protein
MIPSYDYNQSKTHKSNNTLPQAKKTNILVYDSQNSSTIETPNALPRVSPFPIEIEKENQKSKTIKESKKEIFNPANGLKQNRDKNKPLFVENGMYDIPEHNLKDNISCLSKSYKENITDIFAQKRELLKNSSNSNYGKQILMTSFDVID